MPQKTKRTTKTARAHLKRLHTLRLYSFSALAVGLLFIQAVSVIQSGMSRENHVLAYATSMSIGDLYAGTNQARAANGLGGLSLNSKLNSGAQAKANDMIAKNYWSHVSPSGTQPWAFFVGAGYSYTAAGENLAYGFDTSSQVINGWMNSPGHRANLLGPYRDVGFGIASGPNYQGGENTVVVAFYGTPQAAPAPAAPTIPTPPASTAKPKVSVAPKLPTAATPQPAAPAAPPTPAPSPPPQPKPKVDVAVQPAKRITNLQVALHGQASWITYASLGVVGATSIGFAGTHWQLVRRGWKYSRHYILIHPALDSAVLSGAAGIILSSTAGFIR